MFILYLFILITILKLTAQLMNNNEDKLLPYYNKIKSLYSDIMNKYNTYRSNK